MRFQFVLLREKRFFGATSTWVENQKIEVASKEKAIVDGLDQPRYCGEIVEVVKGIWNGRSEIDWDKVLEYALRMNNGAILKRLGFLLEFLEIGKPTYLKEIKKHLTAGYVDLDPGSGSHGKHNRAWRLRINVRPENLTEWRHN
jgi:predicted transcriptional regulator of viral defense system